MTRRIGAYVLLAAFAALFLAPVGVMVAGSLKPDERVLVEAGDARAFVPSPASASACTTSGTPARRAGSTWSFHSNATTAFLEKASTTNWYTSRGRVDSNL